MCVHGLQLLPCLVRQGRDATRSLNMDQFLVGKSISDAEMLQGSIEHVVHVVGQCLGLLVESEIHGATWQS